MDIGVTEDEAKKRTRRTGRRATEETAAVDILIGERVRTVRRLRKMSQTALGHELGITFQQVQKYEHGRNRLSAAQLLRVAAVLDIPVTELLGVESRGANDPAIPLRDRRLLIESFCELPNGVLRQLFLDLLIAVRDATASQK